MRRVKANDFAGEFQAIGPAVSDKGKIVAGRHGNEGRIKQDAVEFLAVGPSKGFGGLANKPDAGETIEFAVEFGYAPGLRPYLDAGHLFCVSCGHETLNARAAAQVEHIASRRGCLISGQREAVVAKISKRVSGKLAEQSV